MIYFDNAATGGFKPRAVYDALFSTARFLSANPGRSGHRLAVTGAKAVYACRETVAEMFNCLPERVIFTKNCTEALNTAILGTLKKGDAVVTTVFEHNSVLRPLKRLEKDGVITLKIVAPEKGETLVAAVEKNITPDAKLKDDLGIDSLDFVDIVVIVERNFGFKIKPEEMAGVVTLSQFCDYIESKVA